jgi:acyl carrier protein phosphodiesterase
MPPALARGVRLHRAIDSYAESHPAFRASRQRVSAPRRRVAGIMVDMFYDHFLARHWADYQPDEPLADFTARQYALLAGLGADLPVRLARILPAMAADDWLASYREVTAIALALDRMAARLSRPNPLPGAGEELPANYAGFERDFRLFMGDARRFAETWRQAVEAAADRE